MSFDQTLTYFDKHYFQLSFGTSIVATALSFFQNHGAAITTLIFVAIVPGVVKLITLAREGKVMNEQLRHETEMHRMAELKAALEIEKLKQEVGVPVNVPDESKPNNN